MSFEKFLGGQQSKIVTLDKVLGIGGEGVVFEKEMEIKLMQGTESDDGKKVENIRLKSKEKKKVAVKVVRFEKDAGENLEGQGFVIRAHYIKIM